MMEMYRENNFMKQLMIFKSVEMTIVFEGMGEE